MKEIKDLYFGFTDAENYKRKEDKEFFNQVFIKNQYLEDLCSSSTSFLIGDKGTGKTAYAVYLTNNDYQNIRGDLKYIRETEYQKFITLKRDKHLQLSDYTQIWKISILLLLCDKIRNTETGLINKYVNFRTINEVIEEYYYKAFSPEILHTLEFVENSKFSAELLSKHANIQAGESSNLTFTETRFQTNLLFIRKKFEDALKQVRLNKDYVLFIDGIDIRPSEIPYDDYLSCIKGLANAVWELNNDFFPTIKGGKGKCRVVLLIRPDIYDNLGLQNQNAKIKDNSVYLDWKTHYNSYRSSNIFRVADKLLSVQQENSDLELGESWDYYFPWDAKNVIDQFENPTSFISFLRFSYHRPRDIISLLNILQENNQDTDGKTSFTSKDFESTEFQRSYSNYLLGELKDQLSFYYKKEDYDVFLKFFEFLNGKDKFDFDYYIDAYQNTLDFLNQSDIKPPQFMNNANEFLQFLYNLNILCYMEKTTDGKSHIHWCFRDRNYSNISPKIKTGVEYQIFYGLAKALNLGKQFKRDISQ
ncbi:P-loop ATPase, Sll1717 family [Psychrobacter okhotskensis]|uniref:P-loop ATPase, Sll1717 family n=1 Tax=Psychrobacter okhotskensis TaxID=212403 RepID=UPI001917DC44|nr:hypothetical protein [Psychrobacter okhotskensis]